MEIEAVGTPQAPRRGTSLGADAGLDGLFGLLLTQIASDLAPSGDLPAGETSSSVLLEIDAPSGDCPAGGSKRPGRFVQGLETAAAPSTEAPPLDGLAVSPPEPRRRPSSRQNAGPALEASAASVTSTQPPPSVPGVHGVPDESGPTGGMARSGSAVGRHGAERLWGYWLRKGASRSPGPEPSSPAAPAQPEVALVEETGPAAPAEAGAAAAAPQGTAPSALPAGQPRSPFGPPESLPAPPRGSPPEQAVARGLRARVETLATPAAEAAAPSPDDANAVQADPASASEPVPTPAARPIPPRGAPPEPAVARGLRARAEPPGASAAEPAAPSPAAADPARASELNPPAAPRPSPPRGTPPEPAAPSPAAANAAQADPASSSDLTLPAAARPSPGRGTPPELAVAQGLRAGAEPSGTPAAGTAPILSEGAPHAGTNAARPDRTGELREAAADADGSESSAAGDAPKVREFRVGGGGVKRLWGEWLQQGRPEVQDGGAVGRSAESQARPSFIGGAFEERPAAAGRLTKSRVAPALPSFRVPGDSRAAAPDTVPERLSPGVSPGSDDQGAVAAAAAFEVAAETPAVARLGASRPVDAREPPRAPAAPPPAQQMLRVARLATARLGERVSVQLEPESLGRVHLVVSREGQGMAAHFRVETPEAQQALTAEAPLLRRELEAQGLSLLRVSVDLDERSGAWREARQERRPGRRANAYGRTEEISPDPLAAPRRRSSGFEARV